MSASGHQLNGKRREDKKRRENNVPEFLTISLNLDKLSNCPKGKKRKREREREGGGVHVCCVSVSV